MRVALLLLAALLVTPPPAEAATPATLVVSGRAGEVATFTIDRTVRLGNGGLDTPVSAPGAPWAGVALTRFGSSVNTYVHYTLRDSLLCPGRRCAPPTPFQPTAGMTDDGRGYAVLSAGRYGVALLGPAGTNVTATIRFRGPRSGRASLRTTERAYKYIARTFNEIAPGVNRGFARVDAPGRVVVDSLAVGFVLDASAAVLNSMCATMGGRRDLDSNVGGIAPCADHSGFDLLMGPSVDPVLVDVNGQAVGIAFTASAGRGTQGGDGMGFDAQAAGPASRVSAVYVSVTF